MNTNSALMIPARPPASNGAAPPITFNDTLKPLIDIPNGWAWFFLILAALMAAAAAYLALRYWRRKRATIKLPPPIPPHVRARRTLDQALALIGQPQPFSVMVSGAIRLYLEERFDFHAPDRTTEEFLYELQSSQLLTQDQKKSLAGFLANCDLIKFAKYEPTEVELRGLHASALRLVNETEPRLVPDAIESSVARGGGAGPERRLEERTAAAPVAAGAPLAGMQPAGSLAAPEPPRPAPSQIT
jgi:hypothetical protein